MSELLQHLASMDLLQGLPKEQLEKFAAIASLRKVRKGEGIFQEGEPGHGFYSVASGTVRIYKVAPTGKELIIHMFGPGHTFGEVAVFANMRFPAHAQAVSAGEVVYLPRDGFRRVLAEDPDVAFNLLGLMAGRLKHFVSKVEALSLKEVPARLAAHLLLLAEQGGGDGDEVADTPTTVTLDMAKGQLAAYLGTIPETLSRILRKLEDAGLVALEGKKITLLDVLSLDAIAQGLDRLE